MSSDECARIVSRDSQIAEATEVNGCAGGAPFRTIETTAVEFPCTASLRFLKECGFRRYSTAHSTELLRNSHFASTLLTSERQL
jgi:hypothetical protein